MSSDVQAKWMNSAARAISGYRREALLQPVFDRLDVVIGRALDRLDALGVGDARTRGDRVERCPRAAARTGHFGDRGLVRERHEPAELDAHALRGSGRIR